MKTGGVIWTEKERDLMRQHYKLVGAKGMQRMLPGRSVQSIQYQAKQLSLLSYSRIDWSEKEDDLLRANYPRDGYKCLPLFPGRTKQAIQRRATTLGISRSVMSKRPPCKRESRYSYGFIKGGPVVSVFDLARQA